MSHRIKLWENVHWDRRNQIDVRRRAKKHQGFRRQTQERNLDLVKNSLVLCHSRLGRMSGSNVRAGTLIITFMETGHSTRGRHLRLSAPTGTDLYLATKTREQLLSFPLRFDSQKMVPSSLTFPLPTLTRTMTPNTLAAAAIAADAPGFSRSVSKAATRLGSCSERPMADLRRCVAGESGKRAAISLAMCREVGSRKGSTKHDPFCFCSIITIRAKILLPAILT